MNRQVLIISVVLCILYSCSRSDGENLIQSKSQGVLEPVKQQRSIQTSVPKMNGIKYAYGTPSPQPAKEERLRGKVVETMNSGGYTYVSIETSSGEKFWAASRKTVIQVGELIDFKKDMEMENFTSKTLGRTFKSIYFVSSFKAAPPTQSNLEPRSRFPKLTAPIATSRFPDFNQRTHTQSNKSKHPVQSLNDLRSDLVHLDPPNHRQPSSPRSTEIQITKAEGGYTIAELFVQAPTLAGREVLVRGKVVKFNSGIMDKNWIHIQDGTGHVGTKTHDLTVTSDQTVSVGKTVLVKGYLTVNRDIGAGYKYPVLIERAKFIH